MLTLNAKDNADNAPSTWRVVRSGRHYHLTDKAGHVLESFDRKYKAVAARESGFYFDLWNKERRWFAGETIPGWKPYAKE